MVKAVGISRNTPDLEDEKRKLEGTEVPGGRDSLFSFLPAFSPFELQAALC